jgi:hypothetical protein
MLRKLFVVISAIVTFAMVTFTPLDASARRGGGGGRGGGRGFGGGGRGFRGGGRAFRGGGFRRGGFRGARFRGFRRRGFRRGYPIIYTGCWRYRWIPTPYGLVYRLVNVCRYRYRYIYDW